MPGDLLLNRKIEVVVGNTKVTGLHVTFKIELTTKVQPNTAEVSIWNLNEKHRSAFQVGNQQVSVSAGYESNINKIFSGKLRTTSSAKKGVDWVTTFKSGDGELEQQFSRVNISFPKGTQIVVAIQQIAKTTGLKVDDALKKIQASKFRNGLQQFNFGSVFQGSATEILSTMLKGCGVQMSIQNGELQLLDLGETTKLPAILLTDTSGLIGSPETGQDKEKKTIMKASCLLQPGLTPGRRVNFQTQLIKGFFKIEKVTHQGDNFSQQWQSDIECLAL